MKPRKEDTTECVCASYRDARFEADSDETGTRQLLKWGRSDVNIWGLELGSFAAASPKRRQAVCQRTGASVSRRRWEKDKAAALLESQREIV